MKILWTNFDFNIGMIGILLICANSLNLMCGGIQAQVHRMKLGMSVIEGFRSSGIGKTLLETAIHWAKDQKQVDWIYLSTFLKNQAARSLYKKFWLIKDINSKRNTNDN